MKQVFLLLLAVAALALFLPSCDKEPPVTGCMSNKALNYKFDADTDDGNCSFSKVTFFGRYTTYNGVPITRVDVSINGTPLGSLTAVYPGGPGNCSAPGTLSYQFTDDRTLDWNSTIYLANGATLVGSGQVSPSRYDACIKVSATP
ncbi:MAG: hypothetical protein EOO08_15470 [Chitinophagaceae bacterium]|nr:MAG: hypothetical protein EOO08_15470 [Chitinophagaceae bacterium]